MGCSGQAQQRLSQSWGPRLTAGRPCAEEERKRLGWHQADPGGLGFTRLVLGLPLLGLHTCSLTVCCMFK